MNFYNLYPDPQDDLINCSKMFPISDDTVIYHIQAREFLTEDDDCRPKKDAVFEGNDHFKVDRQYQFSIWNNLTEFSIDIFDINLFEFTIDHEYDELYVFSQACKARFYEAVDLLAGRCDINHIYRNDMLGIDLTILGHVILLYPWNSPSQKIKDRDLKLIKCLLQNGADPNIDNCWEIARDRDDILKILNEFSKFPRTT